VIAPIKLLLVGIRELAIIVVKLAIYLEIAVMLRRRVVVVMIVPLVMRLVGVPPVPVVDRLRSVILAVVLGI